MDLTGGAAPSDILPSMMQSLRNAALARHQNAEPAPAASAAASQKASREDRGPGGNAAAVGEGAIPKVSNRGVHIKLLPEEQARSTCW